MEKKVKNSVLPYADLSKMYGFRPSKKLIDIGVMTPFCIFGEEEYLMGKKRDTNAQCHSIDVEYYELSIKKAE